MVIQQTDRIIGTIWKHVRQNSLYRILLDCGTESPQSNRMSIIDEGIDRTDITYYQTSVMLGGSLG